MVLEHALPSIQPQSFEWTRTSFEQSVVEFIPVLLKNIFGGGNLFLTLVSKTDHSGPMMFKSGEYAEVHLHILVTDSFTRTVIQHNH
jgi:hypothetical protein